MKLWIPLVVLLAACSAAPITVKLRDFDIPIATVQSGQVVFTQQSFSKPSVGLSSVRLEGNLTYQQGPYVLSFYAANGEPCSTADPGGTYRVCDAGNPNIDLAGTVDFSAGATRPLSLSSGKLTQGINSGNLWIGVKLDSGLLTNGTLQFRNMVAKVAVF